MRDIKTTNEMGAFRPVGQALLVGDQLTPAELERERRQLEEWRTFLVALHSMAGLPAEEASARAASELAARAAALVHGREALARLESIAKTRGFMVARSSRPRLLIRRASLVCRATPATTSIEQALASGRFHCVVARGLFGLFKSPAAARWHLSRWQSRGLRRVVLVSMDFQAVEVDSDAAMALALRYSRLRPERRGRPRIYDEPGWFEERVRSGATTEELADAIASDDGFDGDRFPDVRTVQRWKRRHLQRAS